MKETESSSTEVHISGNVVEGEARFPWRNFFLFLLLFLVSTHWLSRVYANLCIAFVIAFLLEPTVRWLDRKKVPRYLGSLLVMIAFTSLISLVVVLITPKIFSQMNELMVRLPYFFQTFMESVSAKSMQILGYNVFADFERTMQTLSTNSELMKPFGGVVQKVFLSSYQFFSSMLGILVIPLLAYYLLREFPYLPRKLINRAFPNKYHETVHEIRKRLNYVLGGFIRGQLVVSLILAVYYSLTLSLMGLDLSLVLGMAAGFMNIIPYAGILIVLALSLIIALVHDASSAYLIGVSSIFAVGMALEGSVITPKIIGKQVGLSPLTLIVSLLIGSELFGVVGMILAVPVAAIVKVIWSMYLEHKIA